jgi:2-oxoglutarate ferredoxin oxidoreductase subunit beta
VPPASEITTDYDAGAVRSVALHDGSMIQLRKLAADYDPTDRDRAYSYVRSHQAKERC